MIVLDHYSEHIKGDTRMYHFYKAYGDKEYEEHLQESFESEPHSITTRISTQVTFSPSFFRNELEIGLTTLGMDPDIGDKPNLTELMGFDILVLNPLLDLLYEYAKVDKTGAHLAALEMEKVLLKCSPNDDFPDRQIELLEEVVKDEM